jgi:signal peptidase I
MAPTILAGDFILASQMSFGFKFPGAADRYLASVPVAGDIVIYTKNGRSFIKRVVAVPGDVSDYAQDELILNSKKCKYEMISDKSSDYISNTEDCGAVKHGILKPKDLLNSAVLNETKLAPNQYLVAADNRIRSEANSSPLEVINYDQIVGKPLLIWMSYSSTRDFISDTLGIRWNRILTIPK